MIRILLVDDQNLVQQGIKSLLDRDLELKVIGTVNDGRTAVKEIEFLRPDIVLLDIEMPGMDGITTTKYITRLSPKTKVIILSGYEDKKYVTQALMAGAKGYLLKSSMMSDLKQAIIAVNNGYSQIDSRLLAKVFDPSNLKSKKRPSNRSTAKDSASQIKKSPKSLTESKSKLFAEKSLDEIIGRSTFGGNLQARPAHGDETSPSFLAQTTPTQSPDLLDLELQELDSTSTSSGKYQLGTSSTDLIEPEELDSPRPLPSTRSQPKIVEVEIAESDVSEQDTFIQEQFLDKEALEIENIASNDIDLTSSKPEPTKNFQDDLRDFSDLNEVLPEIEPNNSDRSLHRSSTLYDLPPISDRSSEATQSESGRALANSTLTRRSETIERTTPKVNKLSQEYPIRLTTYRPVKRKNRSKSKLKQLIKNSLKYGWVWNVILMILGALVVVAIGSL